MNDSWIRRLQIAYTQSNSWWQTNLAMPLLRSQASFESRHPAGSKYHLKDYESRSRLYRPKTRTVIRQLETACATAFFATDDVVDIAPVDDGDAEQMFLSRLYDNLLTHYLKASGMQWFRTVQGAFQDALVSRVCVTKQHWASDKVTDAPRIDLIPIENFRIDPGSDWTNPIQSSPYIIHIQPMYVVDIMSRMAQSEDKTGMPDWRTLDTKTIMSARLTTPTESDENRDARNRPSTQSSFVNDLYTLVQVLEVIMNVEGDDWVFWSLGTTELLTEPVLVSSVYPQGRPYVMGAATLAAHSSYPQSVTELIADLQSAANDVANLRLDNLMLSMNNGFIVRRGGMVDVKALQVSRPGNIVMVNDPNDVHPIKLPGVDASAYAEQDRVNSDIDSIAGAFDSGSVMTNRKLSETVGGMNLMRGSADSLTDYTLRIFTETWAEPVVRQLLQLLFAYCDDEQVVSLAAKRAAEDQPIQLQSLPAPDNLRVTVNVGLHSSSPQARLERFSVGMQTLAGVAGLPGVNVDEVTKEIFGAIGYRDGARFFTRPDPSTLPPDPKLVAAQTDQMRVEAEIELKKMQLELERAKLDAEVQRAKDDHELATLRLAVSDATRRVGLEVQQNNKQMELTSRERVEAVKTALKRESVDKEIAVKKQKGSGI